MADSLDAGRIAIETYVLASWTATPLGLDGQPFTVTAPSVRMTIIDGAAMQYSIGSTINLIANMGMLAIQLFTDGSLGSSSWRTYAESLLTLFHGKTLDATGALVTAPSQVTLVRFSPPEAGANCHPYIANVTPGTPFRMTNINCPFVRYQRR